MAGRLRGRRQRRGSRCREWAAFWGDGDGGVWRRPSGGVQHPCPGPRRASSALPSGALRGGGPAQPALWRRPGPRRGTARLAGVAGFARPVPLLHAHLAPPFRAGAALDGERPDARQPDATPDRPQQHRRADAIRRRRDDRARGRRPGDHFGEIAALGDRRRTATVRTLTQTSVLSLARQDFAALVEHLPALQDALTQPRPSTRFPPS
ncbi:MAG: cyclic nucleotide-binding domain-containing protein [Chloroflexi bacterium]|nr:MAG: cyclic nucleotide-binding domain-containing protein [Chloroflexota bacterium]